MSAENAENIKPGGRRPGSGRKPLPDRSEVKEQVSFYIERKKVAKLGGHARVKETIIQFINELYSTI
jgi:hypothetical protein